LLEQLEAAGSAHIALVDGFEAGDDTTLQNGALIVLLPRGPNIGSDEPWRATISSFRDEELFQNYAESLKTLRHDLDPKKDESG
jgi:hypothetical protein